MKKNRRTGVSPGRAAKPEEKLRAIKNEPKPLTFHQSACVAAAFAALALVIVLLLPSQALLAANNTDMVSEFVAWRSFLADSLCQGHLPVWDPYNVCV